MRQLNVFVNDRKAGLPREDSPGKGCTFTYDGGYLASDAPAVSVTLPKREKPYKSEHLFPLFANIGSSSLSYSIKYMPMATAT